MFKENVMFKILASRLEKISAGRTKRKSQMLIGDKDMTWHSSHTLFLSQSKKNYLNRPLGLPLLTPQSSLETI